LFVGLAIALVHGHRETSVIMLAAVTFGVWALRLYHAHRMWETKLVQLWPRTAHELICCMVVLCVFAVYLLVRRADPGSAWRSPAASAGVAAGLVLVIMSASSSKIDLFLPTEVEGTHGELAWIAQNMSRKRKPISDVAAIVASSSLETSKFSARSLNDGDFKTYYSSTPSFDENHVETIELVWDPKKRFNRVILYPAEDGFPVDFRIEVWDGENWLIRSDIKDSKQPYIFKAFLLTTLGREHTDRLRIHVTRLRKLKDSSQYAARFGEIEVR
jgi:hypothetical protein